MSDLKNKISELADLFSEGVLAAIRTVSLDELSGEGGGSEAPAAPRRGRPPGPARVAKAAGGGSPGRLARRSPEQIETTIQSIVGVLKKAPEGLRSEQLQAMLGIEKKEIVSPINQALASKILRKEGNKRATCYFVNTGNSSKKTTKSPKKAAAKTGKASKKATKKAAPKKTKKVSKSEKPETVAT
jgi:hypothetical protein